MSLIWLPSNDNIFVAQLDYEIELAKSDLLYILNTVANLKKNLAKLHLELQNLERNSSTMKDHEGIISLKEYKAASFRLKGINIEIMETKDKIKSISPKIDEIKALISKLESKRESIKFKLLRFPDVKSKDQD